MHIHNSRAVTAVRSSALWMTAAVIAGAGLLPVLLVNSASAATVQLTNRKAEVTNATPSATFDITFEFDTPANGTEDVESIEFEFVDDPLAAYDADTLANTPDVTSAAYGSQASWVGATAFGTLTYEVGRNASAGTATNQFQVIRTDTTDESADTDKRITFTDLTHNASANSTFYVRIRLYNDATTQNSSTLVWEGAVAQSTSQTLNVSARVQERLEFCVGSTLTNDATTLPQTAASANIDDCSDMTGNNVDLGVVSNGAINTTPVAPTSGGNNTNGIAMVNTNAVNGTVVSYAAILESGITSGNGGGRLKIDSATCAVAASVIDSCFNSQGATQGTFTAGTERFGMTIGGVNCGSNTSGAYTCAYATGDTNLAPQANYIGGAYTQTTSGTYGVTSGFAWVDDGTYTNIAATTGSTATQVLEDEALILRFAATAAATTPTGQYDVDVDYVATPTY